MIPKDVELELTAEAANWIYLHLARFELPEKLGDKSYDKSQRSIVKRMVERAERAFFALSEWPRRFGKENKIAFGPATLWKKAPNKEDPENFGLEWADDDAPKKPFTIRLNEQAVDGLTWLFIFLLSPTDTNEKKELIHVTVQPVTANLFIWPVAEKLRRVGAIEKALGIQDTDKQKLCKWDSDPEPARPEETKA